MKRTRGTKALLDTNVWDKLALDASARNKIRTLCEIGAHEIVVPNTLLRELEESPFGGVPEWFPVTLITDSVGVWDHSQWDHARFSDGKMFRDHCGGSQNVSDAVIVSSADGDADIFVSEDNRARNRYATLRGKQRSLCYSEFRANVLVL